MKDGRIFNLGEIINGFRVKRVRKSKEIGGAFVEFVHEKTGASLAFTDNNEINKLFCIAFKTLPEDSTGVFHILEHSVLCGSGKYPVKEPFVDLMKSSMSTFLNAFTFQDKTMYPVSSRNDKDFLNLTGVYLDAVFDPALLHNPNIFYQEGRHIEQDGEGNLSYKGVVFNEMKGALSDVDDLTGETILSMLFPGTPYGVNSGGDPAFIPELTYEKFIETYKKYYHPSNSMIYIDGDVPLDETLKLIDSYLSKFGKGEKIADPEQSLPASVKKEIRYDLSENEPEENRSVYMLGRILGTWEEKVRVMAAEILSDVLLGSNFAPLKSAILASGLAQDVEMYVDGIVLQPYVCVRFRNVVDGKAEEIKKLVIDTVKKIAAEGIDKDQLEAAITRYEFHVREQDEPRALKRIIGGLTSWLHDGDPLMYMTFDEDFKALHRIVEEGGYEKLAAEIFCSGEGLAELLALPDHKEGERLRKEENERLKNVWESWTDDEREANRALNESLQKWQQTPDSEEAAATIPVLDLSEVSPEPVIVPTEETYIDGARVFYHGISTNGIIYVNLYFKLTDFTLEELTVLSRAGCFYSALPTEKYDALALACEIKKKLGMFAMNVDGKRLPGDEDRTLPVLTVSFSALKDNFSEAMQLISEILLRTSFEDAERVKEIALQNDESVKQFPIYSGHSMGITEALSGFTSSGAVGEACTGWTMIRYSHYLAKEFNKAYSELKTVIGKLKERLTADRLIIGVTSPEKPDISLVTNAFPGSSAEGIPEASVFKSGLDKKLGFPIPAQIGFAVTAMNFISSGMAYKGSFNVAAKIASLDYLWNVIRVQGGAYGAGIGVNQTGTLFTYSYRDPSPAASLGKYKKISEFLRSAVNSGISMDKYIISTISDSEPLISPRAMGTGADNSRFCGITGDDLRKIRREMLEAGKNDILEFCDVVDRLSEEGAVCVVAYKDALSECEGLTVKEL